MKSSLILYINSAIILTLLSNILAYKVCNDGTPKECVCYGKKMTCSNLSTFPELTNIPVNITELEFNKCNFHDLSSMNYIHNSNVVSLLFIHCEVTQIDKGAFRNMDKITLLDLSVNNIKSLNDGSFDGLSNLETLILSRNKIKSLTRDILSPTQNLKSLRLDDNPYIELQAGTFVEMSKLTLLSMRQCNLKKVPTVELSHAPLLQYLYLDHNEFEILKKNSFEGMTELIELSLDDNVLSDIERGAFNDLKSLKILRLSHNRLQDIEPTVMDPLRENLKVFWINSNALSTLHYNLLDWSKTTEKHLENNPWYCDCTLHFMNSFALSDDVMCAGPKDFTGITVQSATSKMACNCVGEECLPNESKSSSTLVILVVFVIIAFCLGIVGFFGYRYYKRRRLATQGSNIRYSSVYKDTVESSANRDVINSI